MSKKARMLAIVSLAALCIRAQAQGQELGGSEDLPEGLGLALTDTATYDLQAASTPSNRFVIDFSFADPAFSLSAALAIDDDGKYSPLKAGVASGNIMNYYALLESGGLVWRPSDQLRFRLGRLVHRDLLDGPYGLFVSSVAPAALLLEAHYENEYFFYESRWVELNSHSAMETDAYPEGFPDRGANVKAYGLKLGNMRLGLQDAAVYAGRNFDPEYFLSPLPQYFTQYVKATAGRPWATGSNENNIIGAFWDWDPKGPTAFDAQFLVDDFNVWILGVGNHNPWKAAWAARAQVETSIGRFGLSHAGAFKYTFQPTRDLESECYSYTYYPDSRFKIGSHDREIALEDLMFGYKNGENNLALRLDYEGELGGFTLVSNLEFVLSGSKSPTNAWNDETWHDYTGTRMLTDKVLEKVIRLQVGAGRRLGDFVLSGELLVGGAFNALELAQPTASSKLKYQTINNNSYIWKPGDENKFLFGASLGLRYEIPVMRAIYAARPERQ